MRFAWSAAFLALVLIQATPAPGAEWIDSAKSGTVSYFLFRSPPEVARFDGSAGVWLPRIAVQSDPEVLAADANAIYVSSGVNIYRYPVDGGSGYRISAAPATVRRLDAAGDTLVAVTATGTIATFGKATPDGGWLDAERPDPGLFAIAFSPTDGRIYGRSTYGIASAPLSDSGAVGAFRNSSYAFDDLPPALEVYALPSGGLVVDDAGMVYDGNHLLQIASLGGAFDAIDVDDGRPVVARGTRLARYTESFAPAGALDLGAPIDEIDRVGAIVHVFRSIGSGQISAQTIATDAITPPVPLVPPDPTEVGLVPDEIEAADDGVLYLSSASARAVYRWSIGSRAYLSPIALHESPVRIAWLAAVGSLFVGYESGRISKIPVASSLAETHFTTLPRGVRGLADAGRFLFACDRAPSVGAHYVYDPVSGRRTSWVRWRPESPEYVWSEPSRRLLYLTEGSRPLLSSQVLLSDGSLVDEAVDPVRPASYGSLRPLRIRPEPSGSVVALGYGFLHDPVTLSPAVALPHGFLDAAWLGADLYAVSQSMASTELEQWDSTRQSVRSARLPGSAPRIFAIGAQLVVVTQWEGRPRFFVLAPGPADLDGDGVPDASDGLPADASERSDRDGDLIGDQADDLPDDPTEYRDRDGDGVGDNSDAFPDDPSESRDQDGDGVGDDRDAFPDDPDESSDQDGDGIGDNGDAFPQNASAGDALLHALERWSVSGFGRSDDESALGLHFFRDAGFGLCFEHGCAIGLARPKGKKGLAWTLEYSAASTAASAELFELVARSIVSRRTGMPSDVELDVHSARIEAKVKRAAKGDRVLVKILIQFTGRERLSDRPVKVKFRAAAGGYFTPNATSD